MPTERGGTLARRRLVLGGLAAATAGRRAARAQEERGGAPSFLRIATGNVNGTYYQVGGLIADLVSSPPGSRPCDRGGSCGVPGLVAIAQSSDGSVANAAAIQAGEVETGFVQSDVARWAFAGGGPFAGLPPADRLRALANLYPECVHLVTRAGAGIGGVRGLRGRRVSLDVAGSGTTVDARLVLAAFGLSEADLVPSYEPLGRSIDLVKAGLLDAFFLVAGWPAPAVSELVREAGAGLVPIAGPEVDRLLAAHRFFTRATIPADAYPGVGPTPTIAVGAQWIVGRDLDDDLVHGLAKALWHPRSRERLDAGHPLGRTIRLGGALAGVAVPLHPGAERYYRERGMAAP